LLAPHGIAHVADVRSQPYSRFHPQFRRDALAKALADANIAYEFLGAELGARPSDPACFVDDTVDYDKLAATPAFGRGIERAAALAAVAPTVLLCAERDPLTCHRAILVCRHLMPRGAQASHILADGALEPHSAALERLLAEEGLNGADLFCDRAAAVAEAYRRRGRAIAFTRKR
jgi:uncharacterized protein (DUF488 family)